MGSHRAAILQGRDRLLKLPPKFRNSLRPCEQSAGGSAVQQSSRCNDSHGPKMSEKQSKPTGKDTPFPFEGVTRGFCEGGNNASTDCGTEKHDGPYAKGKTVGQDAKISRCLNDATDTTLDDSKVTGTTRREPSAPAKIRSKNNLHRDKISNLGKGKSSSVVLGD